VLYVAQKCASAEYFGVVKLNKILWRADFEAFAKRGVPVTGRQYQRLPLGPAPVEIVPVLHSLLSSGLLEIQRRQVIDYEEQRSIALASPVLKYFSLDDIAYLDAAIEHLWDWTGRVTSVESHGVAWNTHFDGDPLPYESAHLSDEPLTSDQAERFLALAAAKGWNSQ